jgi:hypothetical protein
MSNLFKPFSIIIGLAAGQLSKKIFMKIWGEIRDEEPPNPQHREIMLGQLAVALIVEGAIARLVRGFVDHGSRRAWQKSTGKWPGELQPDPE